MIQGDVLLIVGGGVAAYKSLELVRRLRERGVGVRVVMTRAAQEFATPLSFASLSGENVHTELFELTDEVEMGHIELSRSADLLVIAPATADLLAKMATGRADDLASTLLLATDAPVLAAPAMNVRMWTHPATQRNLETLRGDGVAFVGPNEGGMACGEYGPGRMAEPMEIVDAIAGKLSSDRRLDGLRVVMTSGPTHEPIDPVRYIANRSSGRQGVAIAEALTRAGADVAFVTGPAEHAAPVGARVIAVETALEMRDAVAAVLPADVAIFAAAVADWRVADARETKRKKDASGRAPTFELVENPDILAETAALSPDRRPALVVGFAAETDDVERHAIEKRARKGCDWLLANDVSPETGIMGGVDTEILFVTADGASRWPAESKTATAARLVDRIAEWRRDR